MLGSLVFVGGLPLEEALDIQAIDGARLGDELERIGYAGPLPCPSLTPAAFVELHIEQGPVLEAEGITIGAVTGVQGISWQELTHHRAVQPRRHHARWTTATTPATWPPSSSRPVRRLALETGGHQVGTVGRVTLHPDLVNVVPASATLTVDLRNTDEAVAAAGRAAAWRSGAAELAAAEGVTITSEVAGPLRARRVRRAGGRPGRGHGSTGSGTRSGACRRAPATTPRCWPGSARPGWSSSPAATASATTRPSTPMPPTWRPGSTSCCTSLLELAGGASGRGGDVTRVVTVGAAQLGPVQRDHTRKDVVERLIELLHQAARPRLPPGRLPGAGPHHVLPPLVRSRTWPRCDEWYERQMPGPDTQPLFDEAARLGLGFCLGYAELTPDGHRYNTQILVERDGRVVARYRKVHIPGHEHDEPDRPFQHAERHYFEPGPGRARRVAGLRRAGRHDDLQRPALAGDVPRDGPPGRRADPVRLQHPDPLRP